MRFLKSVLSAMALLVAVQSYAIDQGPAFEDPATQARYEEIIDEVRCLTCQNQSIKDSNAVLAADLRREIREMIAEGKTDDEIYAFLTDRYGDFALYRPRVNERTALLWGAPVLLLLVGGFVLFRVISRRTAMPLDDET